MSSLETAKDLEPGVDYPSIPKLLGSQEKADGYVKIPDQSDEDCFYRFERGDKGTIEVSLTISRPKDPEFKSRRMTIILDASGAPIHGSGEGFFKNGTPFEPIVMRSEQIKKVLKYFQPVVEQSKKDQSQQKERERLQKLPQLPGSITLGLMKLPTRLLDEHELKSNPYILFGERKELPLDPPPVPREFRNTYVHTDRCSVVGQFSNSLFQTNYGVTVFYFPQLHQPGRRAHREGEFAMNTYWDAVVFPKTLRNDGVVLGAWNRAYSMIQGGATDKDVYEFLFEIAQHVEAEAKRNR